MGFIYKITNKVNNKCYIGQTIKTVKKRFQQHCNNYNKSYFSQIALYQAIKKYGLDNFICEQLEEVENEQLNEREKYWIKFYDSYYNGYNSTLGGRLVKLYDWDEDKIIELYLQLKSARQVAKQLNCDHSTIDRILNQNKIHRFSQEEQKAKTIILEKNNQKFVFISPTEAAKWLIENNIVKSKKIKSVRQQLTNNYLKNKTYYGYKINYESKIQSEPLVTKDKTF